MEMTRWIVIWVLTVLLVATQAGAEMVVIVNKANPVSQISAIKLAQYYRGELALWGEGTKVIPVDLSERDPLAVRFTETILKMNMQTKQQMWTAKLLAGKGSPPMQYKDEAAVVSFVASEPGAIGYVSKGSVNDSVKVLTVDGKKEF
jgi:ABC-type phosphate transport system substrate-binding protein